MRNNIIVICLATLALAACGAVQKKDTISESYSHYVTVNFVEVNGNRVLSVMKDGDIRDYVSQMQETFEQCGIEVRLGQVRQVEMGREFNVIDAHPDKFRIGDEERELYSRFNRKGEINVHFIGAIRSKYNTRSSSWRLSWLVNSYSEYELGKDDLDFVGSIRIIPSDVTFGKQAPYTMPHELGHILFDEDHDRTRNYNIMSDRVDSLSYSVTAEQCKKAISSPFVHPL